jgi:hypothetical protein
MDVVCVELAAQLSTRVEASVGLEGSLLGAAAHSVAGSAWSRPVLLRPSLTVWVGRWPQLQLGVSPRLGAGGLLTHVAPAPGFTGAEATSVLLQVGAAGRLRWEMGRFALGVTAAVDAGLAGPALQLAGQAAGTFTGPWLTLALDLSWQL